MLRTSELFGVSRQIADGRWVPALPLPDDFIVSRIRDAWAVLRGRAHAIRDDDPSAGHDGSEGA